MIGVAFTLGMAAVFFVEGLFLSDIGVFIRQARFFDLAAGLLMIILGINIIKPHGPLPVLGLHRSICSGRILCPGLGPCAVSLVFPVLIWLISQNVTSLAGGMMLFVFGVGHGVPLIPIATFSWAVGGRIGEKYIAAGKYVTKTFGLAVIGIGIIYAVRYLGYKIW